MDENKRRIPFLLWPFWAAWQLTVGIIVVTGRLIGAILGMVLLAAGILLSLTLVGAIIGVPLGVLGLLLMVSAVF